MKANQFILIIISLVLSLSALKAKAELKLKTYALIENDTVPTNRYHALKDKEAWGKITETAPSRFTKTPNHVFLHYDYMVATGPMGHNHAPSASALAMMVAAFKAQGLILHIDPNPIAIPEFNVVTLSSELNPRYHGNNAITIYDLKAKYYKPKHKFEHYAVFGHYSECDSPTSCYTQNQHFGSSGIANLPGYNMIISFGANIDRGIPISDFAVAGTLMHELGHNLGLHHGGPPGVATQDINNKPQYLSVMNYSYQFGIPYHEDLRVVEQTEYGNEAPHFNYRIDYSSKKLPSIQEGSVFDIFTGECDGIEGEVTDESVQMVSDHPYDIMRFAYYTKYGEQASAYARANGNPIDWNGNELLDSEVRGDFNGDQQCTLLEGAADWSYIKKFLLDESLQRLP